MNLKELKGNGDGNLEYFGNVSLAVTVFWAYFGNDIYWYS